MGGAPVVAPGLLIADRYRIEALLSDRTPSKLIVCRAHDEVLERTVALLLVPDDDPGVQGVLAGARAAARLTHPSLVRVYDAGEMAGLAFVVTEFLSGGSLEDQLRLGPLEPGAAVDLVSDLAAAVAAAHDAGLHALSLTPRNVLFTATGVARLAGITPANCLTDGGSTGTARQPDDASMTHPRFDAVGLARLLYAGLTGRWPGRASDSDLPPAPYADGSLRTPRQVRGGVPRYVDAVVAQALGDDLVRRGLPEIASPAAFAAALKPLRTPAEDGHPYRDDTAPIPELTTLHVGGTSLVPSRRWRRWAVVVGATLVAVAIGVLLINGPPRYLLPFITGQQPTSNHSTSSATPPVSDLTPRVVSEFDPYGDHTDPHVTEAPRVIDGNLATVWHTQIFRTADLGNTKPGVGVLLDLGTAAKVSSVRLALAGQGTSVAVYASDASAAPTNEKAMTLAASQESAPSNTTLTLTTPTTARFLVIWLTKLPKAGGGFQGGIAEVTLR